MKRLLSITLVLVLSLMAINAQEEGSAPKKVYNEQINPLEQIDQAIVLAREEGKFVICQARWARH